MKEQIGVRQYRDRSLYIIIVAEREKETNGRG